MDFEELKRKVVEAWISEPQNKVALAAAMIAPLRTTRDYGTPCGACTKFFSYDAGDLVRTGGAEDGCPECVVRLVLES